jgi:hypothetical protein
MKASAKSRYSLNEESDYLKDEFDSLSLLTGGDKSQGQRDDAASVMRRSMIS